MAIPAGYEAEFIGNGSVVRVPDYSFFSSQVARDRSSSEELIPYIHFSIVQHKLRRLPIFSASNIYRTKFAQIARSGNFIKDGRLLDFHQLSAGDYEQFNSIVKAAIDRGHMTKREDVQWDINANLLNAEAAAVSTFYYTNAAPQHKKLNIGIWKNLENAIIIKGRVPNPARICVFTGPVLDRLDPEFNIKLRDGASFQIPVLFWKLVYYMKDDQKLYYAGFLMGQEALLQRDGLINVVRGKGIQKTGPIAKLKAFLDFKNHEQYQVPVSFLENLTNLKFSLATDLHKDVQPSALKLIQAKGLRNNNLRGGIATIDGLLV